MKADENKYSSANDLAPQGSPIYLSIGPQKSGDVSNQSDKSYDLSLVAAEIMQPQISASQCQSLIDVLKKNNKSYDYMPSAISGLLVIVGWFVVNRAQANRERRKQIREFIDKLLDDLVKLEELVIRYHTNERNETSEQEVISRLTRFEVACGRLPRFVSNQRWCQAARQDRLKINPSKVQMMRKAMTLYHFADEHEKPISISNKLIREIEITTNDVQDCLESVRLESLG